MSSAVFVSDIHISSKDDPKAAQLARLFDVCMLRGVKHLFLVGDIFDLWISDRDYFVHEYADLIEKLRALLKAGCKVHYFEGNHDLDLRPFWQHKLGASVHSEASFFEIEGLQLRVEHGDQMDPKDRGYLFLRWLLRTPVLVFLERFLPNRIVAWIGRKMSTASRDYTSQIKTSSDDRSRQTVLRHAERVYRDGPRFDYLICGHLHVPMDTQQNEYRVINMGTWLKQPLVFTISNDKTASLLPLQSFLDSK